MGGSKSKRPRPSYEDGHLRDPEVAELQDSDFSKADLRKAIKRAARRNRTAHDEAKPQSPD